MFASFISIIKLARNKHTSIEPTFMISLCTSFVSIIELLTELASSKQLTLNSHINVRKPYISQKENPLPQKPCTTISKIGQNVMLPVPSPFLFFADVINE